MQKILEKILKEYGYIKRGVNWVKTVEHVVTPSQFNNLMREKYKNIPLHLLQ